DRLAGPRREQEAAGARRLQDHREQLEQRALAGAALTDQRDLRAAGHVEPRDAQAKLDASGAVCLRDVSQREDGVGGQGRASSGNGKTESPSTGPPSSETHRSTLSCSAR